MSQNNFPKLHNATWPGIVGKGPDSEPVITFDTMLEMTAAAEVDGVKFDGVDIGLLDPHIDLDMSDDGIKKLADKVSSLNLNIGSLVAPIWGNPAMGSKEERAQYVEQVKKTARFGQKLRELGVRPYGVVRIDSASSVDDWAADPANNTQLIAQTFREACDVAADYGEKLAAEGEICWGGMHSWKTMLETLEAVDRPNLGFQADMSHTLLYLLGYNSPQDRILPADFDWNDRETFKKGLKKLTDALRPWTIDFHVAQNDGTVFGSGSHDKTGRHCLAKDPNGKLDIAADAGYWLRDENGQPTKAFKHICWDGCMFPNEVMTNQQTWNDILASMIKVREAHGWKEA
jgi:sugar phosphate isomerase/epimerase